LENEAHRSKPRGILSGIAPKPYPPSLSRATVRSPRYSSLQQAAEYPGEGEWYCMVSMNVLIGLKLMIFFEASWAD
jgi:hypothetical protein